MFRVFDVKNHFGGVFLCIFYFFTVENVTVA